LVCVLNWASLEADGVVVDGMLSNAMEHMLNIEIPVRREREAASPPQPPPPLYMMDLYKKYLSSDSMKTRSNTIRSIVPIRGQIDGQEMLLFNLSALSASEDISSAELHFYKRRHSGDRGRADKKSHPQHPQHPQQQRRRHWWQLQHLLGYSVVDGLQQIGKWEVEVERRGWMVYDVTNAVDQWEGNSNSHQQMGFLFQGLRRSSGLYNSLPLDSVVRMDPSPFLIVFSNERSNASLEQAAGLKKTPSLNALPDSLPASVRQRRSVNDNELPEMDHFNQNNVIPQSNPAGMLKVRNSGRKSHNHHTPKATSKTTQKTTPTPLWQRPETAIYADSDAASPAKSSTLPYPKSRSGIPEDKRKRSRKGKRRNRKLPETWHYNQQHANDAGLELPEDAGKSLCQRRKLSVDFNEIGWGEWIISPKTFEAQYCAGRCPFPLAKGLNPTNHATIQSIVHAIGGYPEVPAPCCVPDVLSSLTLLYFDDNRNVVLKNYPSMTAESCACR